MRVDSDITFSVDLYPEEGVKQSVAGALTAQGREMRLSMDSLDLLPGVGQVDRDSIGQLAQRLKDLKLVLTLVGPAGPIVSLGDVKPNLGGMFGLRSNAVRVGRWDAFKDLMRRKPAGGPRQLAIPTTLLPLAPTFQRNYRRKPTTTHYSRAGGNPRLVFVRDTPAWSGKPPGILRLGKDPITIGSDDACTLRLPGLESLHVRIVNDELDEYVIEAHSEVGGSFGLHSGQRAVLRSGARIEVGEWRLVYFRAEYADHGRPYGGRVGGELSYQRPQYNPRTGQIEREWR